MVAECRARKRVRYSFVSFFLWSLPNLYSQSTFQAELAFHEQINAIGSPSVTARSPSKKILRRKREEEKNPFRVEKRRVSLISITLAQEAQETMASEKNKVSSLRHHILCLLQDKCLSKIHVSDLAWRVRLNQRREASTRSKERKIARTASCSLHSCGYAVRGSSYAAWDAISTRAQCRVFAAQRALSNSPGKNELQQAALE